MKALQIGIPALFLFIVWLILSGKFDPLHIGLGLVSVSLVMLLSWRLSIKPSDQHGATIWSAVIGPLRWRHALLYPFALLLNIIKANLQVAALVLDPKMRINPVLLRIPTQLRTDAAKILLGNSITLTPGTVTLDIDESDFIVHALSPNLASSLLDGTDQNRIARVFGDPPSDGSQVVMAHRLEDVQR